MITQAEKEKTIFIGRLGEHVSRTIQFDVSDVLADFPGAQLTLLNQRAKDPAAYPVDSAYVTLDGNILNWVIQSGDVAQEGFGRCEMVAIVNNTVAKSYIYRTIVQEALDGSQNPPEPWESWVTTVVDAAHDCEVCVEYATAAKRGAEAAQAAAEAARDEITGMTATAEGLPAGDPPTVVYSHGVMAFGIPKGDTGDRGLPGKDGKDFHISFTFASIAAMEAYSGPIEMYDYAMIDTGSVEDPETGRLYCWESDEEWHYIGDLSGAQGIKGETGDTGNGIASAVLNNNYTLTLNFTDGTSYTTPSIRGPRGEVGQQGEQGLPGVTPNIHVGTVTTGEPGTNVIITISGTVEDPYVNFTIPRGDPGDATIDDTAGDGDTDKVWSADKLVDEFAGKADLVNGKVPASQLPSYVDDVIEGYYYNGAFYEDASHTILITGESGKIYDDLSTGDIYRWGGSAYVKINDPESIIDDTAGSGDTGKAWSADKITSELDEKVAISQGVANAGKVMTVGLDGELAPEDLPESAGVIYETQENQRIASFSDGADGMPVKSLVVGIEPVQTGSGDPAPDNVRPISGWTGMNITRTGMNLFDKTACTNGSFINADGTIGSSDSFCITDYMPVVAGGKISYKGLTYRGTNPRSAFYDENKVFFSSFTQQISGSYTRDVPAGAKWVRFSVSNQSTHLDKNTFMMVSGSEIGEYEAFTKETYAVDLEIEAGTVYGGTLEVYKDGTGKLTVDRAMYTLPEVDSIDTAASGIVYKEYIIENGNALKNNSKVCVISEVAKSYSYNSRPSDAEYCITRNNSNSSSFVVRAGIGTTLAEFNEMYEGTKIVYLLATTTEYTLTSAQVGQITTLLGTNNIFADTGDVLSVDYSADTKMYVDQQNEEERTDITAIRTMIADSDLVTATESHSSGDVFICGNQLLRATDAISTGESIVIGSNTEVINIADYIAEVVSSVSGLQTNLLGRMQDTTEKFMLLNSSNCGADQSINTATNQTKAERHINRIKFSKLGTNTTYRIVLLYGGDLQIASGTNLDNDAPKRFSSVTPITIPFKATNPVYSDWAIDVSIENDTPSVTEGITLYIATYDTANDAYTVKQMLGFAANVSKRCDTINLSQLIPEIVTNGNFIIYARIRTGNSAGTVWFNLHTVPHVETT